MSDKLDELAAARDKERVLDELAKENWASVLAAREENRKLRIALEYYAGGSSDPSRARAALRAEPEESISHDSPNFEPDSLKELRARGYKRINREPEEPKQ
jgi:hypothetical protein